ncbi:MAG: heavy metal translocating P-type ATPase [Bacillota bacterium]|nr:heavy metal translocating P-type ATPase [Bacillota bacterium]
MSEKLNLKYDEDRGTYYEEVQVDSHDCDTCSCGGCQEKVKEETIFEKVEENSGCSCGHCSVDIDVTKIEPEKDSKKNLNNLGKRFTEDQIEMGSIILGALLFIAGLIYNGNFYVDLSLYMTAYLILGFEIISKAVKNILKGDFFDENFLMSIASIGAIALGEYPEAVGVMLFYRVGELLQDRAADNSKRSIKALLNIKPDYANLVLDGVSKKVSPGEVSIGDMILVKPGEKIPLDGRIINGNTAVDNSALTGESIPVDLEEGDRVLSGGINKQGLITVEVEKEFKNSTVSRILDLVQNASSKKSKTENFITKFAKYYTPGVVFLATAIAFIPPLILEGAEFRDWIYRGLIFLVVSCPCALVLSIPLAYFGGLGAASHHGILIKGGNYLEALTKVDKVIFDKTGTLTKGKFKVTKVVGVNGFSKEEVLEYAAYGEAFSNHPIGESIKDKYGKEINEEKIRSQKELAGFGIEVEIDGKKILVGNRKLIDIKEISIDEEIKDQGTLVYLAVEGKFAGYILIKDELKATAIEAIKNLKKLNIKKTIMLTGDNESTASEIGKIIGIDEYYSQLLPEDKVRILEDNLKDEEGKTIFVGDGINDAPVIARADVGVAMGGLGSDAAIEAADIVLMTDEPEKLVHAFKIAKMTRTIVWQNIIFALGIKALVMVLSTFGLAQMYQAVFADVGVALIAVLNSVRILKIKL